MLSITPVNYSSDLLRQCRRWTICSCCFTSAVCTPSSRNLARANWRRCLHPDTSTVLCQKALSAIFCHFHFFTDYDITPNYASVVKFLEVSCNPKLCFWRLNTFLKGSKFNSLISIMDPSDSAERFQATKIIQKGAKRHYRNRDNSPFCIIIIVLSR